MYLLLVEDRRISNLHPTQDWDDKPSSGSIAFLGSDPKPRGLISPLNPNLGSLKLQLFCFILPKFWISFKAQFSFSATSSGTGRSVHSLSQPGFHRRVKPGALRCPLCIKWVHVSPVHLEQQSFVPPLGSSGNNYTHHFLCSVGSGTPVEKGCPKGKSARNSKRVWQLIPINTQYIWLLPMSSTGNAVSLRTGALPTLFTTVSPVPGTRKHSISTSWMDAWLAVTDLYGFTHPSKCSYVTGQERGSKCFQSRDEGEGAPGPPRCTPNSWCRGFSTMKTSTIRVS